MREHMREHAKDLPSMMAQYFVDPPKLGIDAARLSIFPLEPLESSEMPVTLPSSEDAYRMTQVEGQSVDPSLSVSVPGSASQAHNILSAHFYAPPTHSHVMQPHSMAELNTQMQDLFMPSMDYSIGDWSSLSMGGVQIPSDLFMPLDPKGSTSSVVPSLQTTENGSGMPSGHLSVLQSAHALTSQHSLQMPGASSSSLDSQFLFSSYLLPEVPSGGASRTHADEYKAMNLMADQRLGRPPPMSSWMKSPALRAPVARHPPRVSLGAVRALEFASDHRGT